MGSRPLKTVSHVLCFQFPYHEEFSVKCWCSEESWFSTASIESDNIASDTQREWNVINLTQGNTASLLTEGVYLTVIGYDWGEMAHGNVTPFQGKVVTPELMMEYTNHLYALSLKTISAYRVWKTNSCHGDIVT